MKLLITAFVSLFSSTLADYVFLESLTVEDSLGVSRHDNRFGFCDYSSNNRNVFVYDFDGSSYNLEGSVLNIPNVHSSFCNYHRLSLYNNHLVVLDDQKIHHFHFDSSTWTLNQQIDATLTSSSAVAVSDNIMLVSEANTNTVEKYDWNGTHWNYDADIARPETGDNFDLFGATIDYDGVSDRWVIAAPQFTGGGITYKGKVWVFDNQVSNPVGIEAPSPVAQDKFGRTVNLKNDTIVVGTPGYDTTLSNRGALMVFTEVGSVWSNQHIISIDTTLQLGVGGSDPGALDFDGEHVIHCRFSSDKVLAFSFNDTDWTEEFLLDSNSNAGRSCAIYNTEIVIPLTGLGNFAAVYSERTAAPTSSPTGPTAPPTPEPTTSPTPSSTLAPVITPNGTVVSKLEIAYELADESDASSTVESLIERADLLYPASTYRNKQTTVSITITGVFSNALYDIVNNEQLLYDTIKETKCGTATSACTITNPSARRVLVGVQENEFQFELVIELDSSQYSSLDGIDIEDPGFITALESTLGITHEETYTISTIDNEIIIQVSIISDNGDGEPLGSDIISDANEMFNNLTAYTTELVSTLGVNGDFVTSTELIKCPVERTCNGQGHELCNEATGVCDCGYFNGDWWWGIDCETKCECDNGAQCVKGICECTFPQWGLRCQNVKEGCTTECAASNVETYECCTGLDTPTDCGCCTSGAVPVDYDTNGSCTSREGGWCSSTQGEDTFGCFILP
jgi:hypothetical protein